MSAFSIIVIVTMLCSIIIFVRFRCCGFCGCLLGEADKSSNGRYRFQHKVSKRPVCRRCANLNPEILDEII